MRKLTVKNFSVIQEAELEFGKITVLIGPQSSGKSLLCKLAYFFEKELIEIAVNSIESQSSWDEYLRDASKAFSSRFFSANELVLPATEVIFSSHQYRVSLRREDNADVPLLSFGKPFKEQYELLQNHLHQNSLSVSGAFIPGGLSATTRREKVWIELNEVLSGSSPNRTLFIPAGRAFFTNTSKGYAFLQNIGIDSITREFAAQIQWDSKWKIGLMTSGRGVTDEISRFMTEISRGFVLVDSGIPRFLTTDGRKLPLEILSTGIQEMLPLFNILDQVMYFREHHVVAERANYDPPRKQPAANKPLLYLEEPETSVFPKTQYALVQLFSWLANDPILNFDWTITTHSPYILTAFNTLIEAWRVGNKPGKHDKAAAVIPEQYWIDEKDFKAYAIHDGKLIAIFKVETEGEEGSGLIDGDYLDSVSDELGSQFDHLLDIEYAE